MKCETCQGRGFIEYEHGLLMVGCEVCNGTGEVEDVLTVQGCDVFQGEPIGSSIITDGGLNLIAEELNDSDSGTGRIDNSAGSGDTSEPEQQKKPRAKKKAGKGTRKIL